MVFSSGCGYHLDRSLFLVMINDLTVDLDFDSVNKGFKINGIHVPGILLAVVATTCASFLQREQDIVYNYSLNGDWHIIVPKVQ